MKNERCAINFEIFLLDILSCKGAFRLHVSSVLVYTKTYMFREYFKEKKILCHPDACFFMRGTV